MPHTPLCHVVFFSFPFIMRFSFQTFHFLFLSQQSPNTIGGSSPTHLPELSLDYNIFHIDLDLLDHFLCFLSFNYNVLNDLQGCWSIQNTARDSINNVSTLYSTVNIFSLTCNETPYRFIIVFNNPSCLVPTLETKAVLYYIADLHTYRDSVTSVVLMHVTLIIYFLHLPIYLLHF